MGRHHRADDLGTRLLPGLVHDPPAESGHEGLLGRHLVAISGQVDSIGRIALPDREDHVDRFGEHAAAVLGEDAEDRSRMFAEAIEDRKSTRLNSSHSQISYAVFCFKKKKKTKQNIIL